MIEVVLHQSAVLNRSVTTQGGPRLPTTLRHDDSLAPPPPPPDIGWHR